MEWNVISADVSGEDRADDVERWEEKVAVQLI